MRLLSIWILLAFVGLGSSFRLNVPRALLPFHDSVQVKYSLEVSQPTGGCFHWRSTRPDVVSVTPVGAQDCSDRAELTVTSVVHNGVMNAVIFANDRDSGSTLSCAITVDKIAEVRIETTTKVLFVDAAPVRMLVKAINKDGDFFSTLSGIPINWELAHSGAEKPLRIVNFMQSAYEAPQEILALEKNKKKGYLVLVEGIAAGSAILTAKFNDPSLKHIAPNKLDLTVVANLLLLPAHDLYVPLQAEVNFEVLIVRQQGTEVVHMPSPAHFLKVDSEKVCSLDTKSSRITALSRGSTEIHLFSTNVDLKAKTGVRPPSTIIHVVEPGSLLWSVDRGNWILESGKPYTLTVGLRDSQGNNMHISDNLRFESYVNKDVFDILHVSDNQTHFVVSPKKTGKTKVTSRLAAAVNKAGSPIPFGAKVRGEQDIQIVFPVATVEVSADDPLKLELDEVVIGVRSNFPVSCHFCLDEYMLRDPDILQHQNQILSEGKNRVFEMTELKEGKQQVSEPAEKMPAPSDQSEEDFKSTEIKRIPDDDFFQQVSEPAEKMPAPSDQSQEDFKSTEIKRIPDDGFSDPVNLICDHPEEIEKAQMEKRREIEWQRTIEGKNRVFEMTELKEGKQQVSEPAEKMPAPSDQSEEDFKSTEIKRIPDDDFFQQVSEPAEKMPAPSDQSQEDFKSTEIKRIPDADAFSDPVNLIYEHPEEIEKPQMEKRRESEWRRAIGVVIAICLILAYLCFHI